MQKSPKFRGLAGRTKRTLTRSYTQTQIINTLDDHTQKINEALFFIHRLKNGLTVRTGEFEALTALFTGQKMYVDTRDISVAPHLMLDGIWEPEITKVYRSLIKRDSIVIDVGANFGYFGIVAGTTVEHEGGVYFIEANNTFMPYIRKSVAVNGMEDIATISNIGIGDKDSSLELQLMGDYWGSSSFSDSQVTGSRERFDISDTRSKTVKVTTLDSYCLRYKIDHIDILKVDIEGFEEAAYSGMKRIIKQSPNMKLLLEFTPASYKNPEKFYNKIIKDFKFVYAINQAGELKSISTYNQLAAITEEHGWSMILAMKTPFVA